MFESLTDKLQDTYKTLTGRGKLSEENIEEAMRDVRLALLDADVNFKIVKDFVARVKIECLGDKVLKSVTPGQQFVKIVNDELTRLMGDANAPLELESYPSVIMMVGLHGSGKTTTTAKLANHLKKKGKHLLLVAADVHRPAAVDQLEFLGKQLDLPVHSDRGSTDVVAIAKAAIAKARADSKDTVIIDTAGRLQIDQELVQELVSVRDAVSPDEILLVADAAIGQEAVSVAKHFHEALTISGIVLTKLDGDARGGAALSMREVTGRPIKFIGLGEKIEDLEPFHPERMASRILGMGDVVSLVEKAAETISEADAKKLEKKMIDKSFDLNDFLGQLAQLKKLGGMKKVLDFIPGGGNMMKGMDFNEDGLKHVEAIVQSMTPYERSHPEVLGQRGRRERIAKGCGRPQIEVNALLKRFETMRGMMSKWGRMAQAMQASGGAEGMAGGMPAAMPSIKGTKNTRQLSQKEKKAKRKKNRKRR